MARSATTGRYVKRRRLVGAGRRLRITGGTFDEPEVGGVKTGPTLYLSGGPAAKSEPKPKAATSSSKD